MTSGEKVFITFLLAFCIPVTSLQAQSRLGQRAGWTALDPAVLALLERRLTPADLKRFVEFSEALGLVQSEFPKLAGRRPAPTNPMVALGNMAVLFTNLANNYGQKGDLSLAGKCAATALKLNANHVPAMLTLIQINLQTGNCPTAKSLISMARSTLARLAQASQKQGAADKNAIQLYGDMRKQLDAFARQCP
ncbi:MAG TPA: hypothetical protein VGK99_16570 [Acidobacteriota bacterium]|jgi:hypothetical protein